ncbi:response regulator [Spartinivicinus ruber]|uniref:response regulator n=1 Tax=Spartinivicinus ruber TaxID=2683272 RepID=UPI001CA3B1E6|nr:response regulator [Spartinivicinus ruber]
MCKKAEYLVVDDEPDIGWVMKRILGSAGGVVVTLQTGAEVLPMIEKNHFSRVFMDAKLPDIEGLELAREVHKLMPELQVVLVSGYYYKDDPTIQKALSEGLIDDFIAKPFTHSDILKIL